ncbi:putative F-box domain, FBD domain, leucine-rich repeat domain, L domain-containing protein [Medicago truncatula]|uniref:Putative F-box domain, FBD domain, leucine-rich repeat domain, L domain-containing protein n=1 Tax=Medicago truncatula TaxID=3880 RepID=A0A396IAI5_MEDTR|nr:F-box/FBD/LRR-repeat protein At1g13570 isoform X1 [Medicago truncatula]RHN60675.1 putative F-box domain, FBD domain, leucine-rich repeat domain, L domain-containing protein [Medicago truncatula]
MGRKRSKSTCLTIKDAELDRISSLPGNVTDQILLHLPIKEALRTSVLSSKWRNKWYTMPNLVFDKHCVSDATFQDPSGISNKFLRIVDHVLLLHSGSIDKFKICDKYQNLIGMSPATDTARWILHLIRRSIKELVLDIRTGQSYKIPWCLFSCQSLHHLELTSCWLKPPTTFEGFRNLESLSLIEVTMTQDAFENLIFKCPLLETLELVNLHGFTQINIHTPNLKSLLIVGKFDDISFDKTFQFVTVLVDLSLYLNSETNQRRLHGCSSSLLNFFNHRPRIVGLVMKNYFLKYLAAGVVPVKLPTPCIHLSHLLLNINFNDLKEISAALCLLRSSPNLRKLKISARIEEQTDLLTPASYCWEDIFSRPDMPLKVQHVTIDIISGFQSELDFIRFLLLNSPMLEKMTVKPLGNVRPELVTELIRFKSASGEAEVIYHVEDSS